MTPEAWCVANADRLRAIAWRLCHRWPVPPAVTPDDVEQELRLGIFLAWKRFDPSRGVDRSKYALWSASRAAAHWLHIQRGDRSLQGRPSKYPFAASTLGSDGLDLDLFPAEDLPPDGAAALLEAVRQILAATKADRAQLCAAALVDGSYATGDWHARVLLSHSVGMFAEVQRDRQKSLRGRDRQAPTERRRRGVPCSGD